MGDGTKDGGNVSKMRHYSQYKAFWCLWGKWWIVAKSENFRYKHRSDFGWPSMRWCWKFCVPRFAKCESLIAVDNRVLLLTNRLRMACGDSDKHARCRRWSLDREVVYYSVHRPTGTKSRIITKFRPTSARSASIQRQPWPSGIVGWVWLSGSKIRRDWTRPAWLSLLTPKVHHLPFILCADIFPRLCS
jgi:hypothetical protein